MRMWTDRFADPGHPSLMKRNPDDWIVRQMDRGVAFLLWFHASRNSHKMALLITSNIPHNKDVVNTRTSRFLRRKFRFQLPTLSMWLLLILQHPTIRTESIIRVINCIHTGL
jgi:hypothetical protein